jgi:hypothetical protein
MQLGKMSTFFRNKHLITAFLVSVLMSLISCEKDKTEGDVVTDSELVKNLLSKCSDTLTFDSCDYVLEVSLYRDYFPGVPLTVSRPLIASVFLVNLDGEPVSADLKIEKLYVINNDQIWIASLKNGVDSITPTYKLNKLNTGGPEWDTGTYVDVIMEIESKFPVKDFFLIARHQLIERIE